MPTIRLKIVSILTLLLIIPVIVIAESQLNKIKGVTVKNITINSASVSWNKSKQAKYYQLRLQNGNGDNIKTWKNLSKNSKKISASLAMLSEDKQYQVKVRACIKDNCSKWSAIKSFDTLTDADSDDVDSTLDCNDADQNVNSYITYYADTDADGYGDVSVATAVCSLTAPTGYVTNASDANDSDYDNDGVSSSSDCNDSDNSISVNQTYYRDADSDGYGSTTETVLCAATAPSGYSTNNTDCSDTNNAVNSNQTYYRDADEDGLGLSSSATVVCSTTAPTGYVTNASDTNDEDYDNDSHITSSDCNDHDATVYSTYYADVDQDGYGNPNSTTCSASSTPSGYVTDSSDADDNDYFNGNNPGCGSDTYNCTSFSTQFRAQKYYDYCVAQGAGDIHNLDGDSDGEACESLN